MNLKTYTTFCASTNPGRWESCGLNPHSPSKTSPSPLSETAIIFKCKAVTESPKSWIGGYQAIISYLKNGFLKSQEQLLRAERALTEDGYLEILRPDIPPALIEAKRVLRVSISMYSFGELHAPSYASTLLSHFCNLKISTQPPSSVEEDITSIQIETRSHIAALSEMGSESNDVYRRTIFIDLALLSRIIEVTKTFDELAKAFDKGINSERDIGRVLYAE